MNFDPTLGLLSVYNRAEIIIKHVKLLRTLTYKLGIMTYNCLHCNVPQYLVNFCQQTSDISSRQHLRSARRGLLVIPWWWLSIHVWLVFLCGRPINVELTARVNKRFGSWQRQLYTFAKNVLICELLTRSVHNSFYNDLLHKSTFYLLTYLVTRKVRLCVYHVCARVSQ